MALFPNFVTPPRYAPSRSNSKFLHSSPCLLTTPSRRVLSLSSGGTSRISSSFELFRSNRRQRRARCALVNFEHFVGITSVFLPQGGTENVPLFEGAAFSLLFSLSFFFSPFHSLMGTFCALTLVPGPSRTIELCIKGH